MTSYPYLGSTTAPQVLSGRERFHARMTTDLPQLSSLQAVASSGTGIEGCRRLARSRSPFAGSLAGGRWIQFVYVLIDLSFVLLTFVAVAHVPFASVISRALVRLSLPDYYLDVALMYGSLVVLFCHFQGLYRTSRDRSNWDESTAVMRAVLAATVLFSAFIYVSGIRNVSRSALAVSAMLIMASLVAWRVWKRGIVERRVAAGIGVKNVLIVGAGKVGQELADHLDRNKQLGLVVKGFLDHNHHGDPRVLRGF